MAAKIQVKLLANLKGHKQSVYTLCLGADQRIYSAGGDGFLVCWNYPLDENGTVLAAIPEPVYSLAWNDSSKDILVGSSSGKLFVVGVNASVRNFQAHSAGIFHIDILENGFVLTTGGDGKVLLWNSNYEIVRSVALSTKSIRAFASCGANNVFAFASSDWNIYITNHKLELLETWSGHTQSVFALSYEAKKNRLFSSGRDAVLRSWDLQTAKQLEPIAAHLLHVHSMALQPAGAYLATASMDKTIKLWNLENMELLKVLDITKFDAHTSSVNKLLWLNANTLVSCSDDRTVLVWEIV